MSLLRPIALAAAVSLLAACASVPKPLMGNYADVSAASAQQGGAGGTRVRWGGEIIKTEPGPQQTCFYLLRRALDDQARPASGSAEQNDGRFVACRTGFYDPEVFTKGRELTVTGTLHGIVSRKVGEYDYAYPRVEADVVYLWPRRVVRNYPPGYGFNDPFWGPWGPGYGGFGPWGYGGYPYWYQPRQVIVVPRGGYHHGRGMRGGGGGHKGGK